MTTIKEIAQKAGVSIATVSRVFNKQTGVSKAKRQKVLNIAQELGFDTSRYKEDESEKIPEILIMLLDQNVSESTEAEIMRGLNAAHQICLSNRFQVETYTYNFLDEAYDLLDDMQAQNEDLNGLILIGQIPDPLFKYLKYLRGKGCPIVLVDSQTDEISPLYNIHYGYMEIFKTLEELILLLDQKKTGLVFHQMGLNIAGEGYLNFLNPSHIIDSLQEHYPDEKIAIQNKGPFSPELFPNTSIIVCDSYKATEHVVRIFHNEANRPKIIAYHQGKQGAELLEKKQIDCLVQFSAYKLAFYGLYALCRRLEHKLKLPQDIAIYPRIYFPSQADLFLHEQINPVLLDELAE